MFKKILVILLSSLIVSSAFACPPGPGETELTFSQIMINFGKLLRKADSAALEGTDFPEDVTADEIKVAVEGIRTSLTCVDAVLVDGGIMPPKVSSMDAATAATYTESIRSYMRAFRTQLVTYENLFLALKPADPTQDYTALYAHCKAIQAWATTSHENL